VSDTKLKIEEAKGHTLLLIGSNDPSLCKSTIR